MAYEPRVFQAVTTNTPPTGTDPMVDNTANGDVQAIKILDGTVGSTTPLAGQKARAISLSTTLSTEDIAALTPPAAIVGFATSANQTTELASLSSIDAKTPALGQALAAASTPVVMTAAQITTLTPPAAITGFLTEANFDTKTGSLTEAAPATDTASSGLNGRLQRLAQRITTFLAVFPTTIDTNSGNKSASTLRVVIATDQPALTTGMTTKTLGSTTPSQTTVASSATTVSLLALNTNRLGATVYNESTAILYLKLGATASLTSYSIQMFPSSYYEVPFSYTGAIDGIWASANGNARITELT